MLFWWNPRGAQVRVYYEGSGIKLYHGDCRDVSVECDLIVTDPPYGQEFKSSWSDMWGPIKGDENADKVFERVTHALDALRQYRHFYCFGTQFDFTRLPATIAELIWDKQILGMGDLALPWGPQHEKITFGVWFGTRGNRGGSGGKLAARLRRGSILRSLRPNSSAVKHHPTEKPVDILRQMIESSSVMGETVYDPFAGSGSTLIAAAIEGRNAVGCEIEERYCEIAANRIERETLPLLSVMAAE